MEQIMRLYKPTQELRRDLKDIAHLLKWSTVDLIQLAVRLSEAGLKAEALELTKKLEALMMQRTSWRVMGMR